MDLADLEDLEGEEIVSYEQPNENGMALDEEAAEGSDMEGSEDEAATHDVEEADRLLMESIKRAEDVYSVAKLYGSKQLNDVLEVSRICAMIRSFSRLFNIIRPM